jgi:peptidoglycan hydrolase-like protein with peptidoglycan-binding domain
MMERAIENPAASGGLLVMALTAGAIVVNATYLQPGDYPRPHLAPTRAQGASSTPPVPTPRPAAVADVARMPPAITATAVTSVAIPAVPAKPVVPVKLTPDQEAALIADIQRELARRNLYVGAIDGIAGPRTKAAITAYQTSAGLPATGLHSSELLTQMRPPVAGKPTVTGSAARPGLVPPATIPVVVAAAAPAAAKPQITSVIAEVNAADAESYRRVQIALNQMGYGAIPVDGKPGKETSDAIRRFELDYGLPVTGQPSEAVSKRLVTIGAMAQR